MNDTTGRYRAPRRAGALAAAAAAAAIAVLATACGGGAASSADPPTYAQEIALVGCMRSHGVPNFPDPTAAGGYSLTADGSLVGADGSVDIDSSQAQTAYGDCRHLLPGGPSISQLEQDVQQAQQAQAQALPVELKYSQCMRSHGVPNFPSPGQPTTSPQLTHQRQLADVRGRDQRLPAPAAFGCARDLPAVIRIPLRTVMTGAASRATAVALVLAVLGAGTAIAWAAGAFRAHDTSGAG